MPFDIEPNFLSGYILFAENVEVKNRSGQLVQGVVKRIDRTHKVVYLSSDPDVVSKCVVCFWNSFCRFGSLLLYIVPFCLMMD